MIVTLSHLRSIPGYGKKPGFCASKARVFFARHDLDWYTFRHEGLPEQKFIDTGDALAMALVEWARTCQSEAEQ